MNLSRRRISCWYKTAIFLIHSYRLKSLSSFLQMMKPTFETIKLILEPCVSPDADLCTRHSSYWVAQPGSPGCLDTLLWLLGQEMKLVAVPTPKRRAQSSAGGGIELTGSGVAADISQVPVSVLEAQGSWNDITADSHRAFPSGRKSTASGRGTWQFISLAEG